MSVGSDEGAGADQVVGEGIVVADIARHRCYVEDWDWRSQQG